MGPLSVLENLNRAPGPPVLPPLLDTGLSAGSSSWDSETQARAKGRHHRAQTSLPYTASHIMRAVTVICFVLLASSGCLARKHRQLRGDEDLHVDGLIKDAKHHGGHHDHDHSDDDHHGPPHDTNGTHHGHGPHDHHHGPPGPPFCHGAFCPEYEVLNKTFEFETRQYNASSWAATNVSGWAWEFALPKAIQKLMGYAHGGNQKDKHFPPGVPIISKYLHSGDYSNCDKNFLVAAYVPKKPGCNATLPTPIDPSVVVKSFPAAKAYVRSFPGFGFHWTFLAEAFKMAKALEQDKIEVRDGMFFAAVYDPPTRLFGRHNEVWFLPAKDSVSADFLWASEGTSSISGAQLEQLRGADLVSA